MISKREVEHIAKLARLGLSQAEIKKFQKELSRILEYFEQLKEVDIAKVEPTSHSVFLENVMREDEAEIGELEAKKKIIEQAPEKKEGYIKVKAVL